MSHPCPHCQHPDTTPSENIGVRAQRFCPSCERWHLGYASVMRVRVPLTAQALEAATRRHSVTWGQAHWEDLFHSETVTAREEARTALEAMLAHLGVSDGEVNVPREADDDLVRVGALATNPDETTWATGQWEGAELAQVRDMWRALANPERVIRDTTRPEVAWL